MFPRARWDVPPRTHLVARHHAAARGHLHHQPQLAGQALHRVEQGDVDQHRHSVQVDVPRTDQALHRRAVGIEAVAGVQQDGVRGREVAVVQEGRVGAAEEQGALRLHGVGVGVGVAGRPHGAPRETVDPAAQERGAVGGVAGVERERGEEGRAAVARGVAGGAVEKPALRPAGGARRAVVGTRRRERAERGGGLGGLVPVPVRLTEAGVGLHGGRRDLLLARGGAARRLRRSELGVVCCTCVCERVCASWAATTHERAAVICDVIVQGQD
jgi:hypothetical protein